MPSRSTASPRRRRLGKRPPGAGTRFLGFGAVLGIGVVVVLGAAIAIAASASFATGRVSSAADAAGA
ncbi:MAG: hypothetical protein JWP75_3409, partial [Frondihabitans sp.]|nr:hypothetical protein [Frondihabitans sp.]